MSKSVTLEIVEYVLDEFPDAATVESEDETSYNVCGESFGLDRFDTYRTFPLHLACHNQYCPSSIISLLIKRYSTALEHHAPFGYHFAVGAYDGTDGLPLHYYVARKTNVDIETTKMLIEAYPQAMVGDDEMYFTPMHAMVNNPNENITI